MSGLHEQKHYYLTTFISLLRFGDNKLACIESENHMKQCNKGLKNIIHLIMIKSNYMWKETNFVTIGLQNSSKCGYESLYKLKVENNGRNLFRDGLYTAYSCSLL